MRCRRCPPMPLVGRRPWRLRPTTRRSRTSRSNTRNTAAPKRAALVEPTVTLVPGPAEVTVNELNVRGQAGLKGEVIGALDEGRRRDGYGPDNLDKHAAGEPAQWAKIALPASIHIWVNTQVY